MKLKNERKGRLMSNNSDFFEKKKPWSIAKDLLLEKYLWPYLTKIAKLGLPLTYIDGFAGQGRFEDGSEGSPLIALNKINEYRNSDYSQIPINAIFVEKKHSLQLQNSIMDYPNCKVFAEDFCNFFEREINNIPTASSVFMYLDPFGYSSLKYKYFDQLATRNFRSLEMLINFNSFGFVRNACRVMKLEYFDEAKNQLLDGDEEIDSTKLQISRLNSIAGGDYWQQIIKNNTKKRLIKGLYKDAVDGKTAEIDFKNAYLVLLKKKFRYVLEMPVSESDGSVPKYRMLFVTNHRDGFLLMVDNICNRWKYLKDSWNSGQLSLFEDTQNSLGKYITSDILEETILDHIYPGCSEVHITDFLVSIFEEQGPICKTGDLSQTIKRLEAKDKVVVRRVPPFTPTGKVSKFMDEKNGHHVFVGYPK